MDLGEPGSYLTLTAGMAVLSSDGARLGAVTEVLAEEDKDIFEGIRFEGADGERFVAADAVAEIRERGVVLAPSA